MISIRSLIYIYIYIYKLYIYIYWIINIYQKHADIIPDFHPLSERCPAGKSLETTIATSFFSPRRVIGHKIAVKSTTEVFPSQLILGINGILVVYLWYIMVY